MSYEAFLREHFPDLKIRGYQATARCLFHDDKRQSFSVNLATGQWMCFANCGHGNTITLARRLGVQPPLQSDGPFMSGPRISAPKSAVSSAARTDGGGPPNIKVVAEYIYEDENGQPIYKVIRTDPKGFFQKKWTGSGWAGGSMGDVRRVIYRLPKILKQDKDKWLFLVEGEKDVHKLESLDLVATTTAMGASSWNANYAAQIAGRRVAIIPDNDQPGQAYGERAAGDLVQQGCRVKLVRLPGLGDKGDVSDYLEIAGNSRETLLDCVRSTQECGAVHRSDESPFDYFARHSIVLESGENALPGEFRSLCQSAFLAASSSLAHKDVVFDIIEKADSIWRNCRSKKEYHLYVHELMKAHAA